MSDLIEREAVIEAIEGTDWYHQNRNKDMVSGANDDEHQAWYKADDIYKVLEAIPSARPKEGKWIEAGRMTQFNQFYYFRYCSKCFYARDDCDSEKDTNFCPNCCADMREREGE